MEVGRMGVCKAGVRRNDCSKKVKRDGSCAKLAVLVDDANDGHDRAGINAHQRAQKGRRGKRRGFGKNCMHGNTDDDYEGDDETLEKANALTRRVSSDSSQSSQSFQSSPKRRRRGRSARHKLESLAHQICSGKRVVLLTGAGLSVNSGIRPFRGKEGLWSQVVWSSATREAFRADPLAFYNDFWLPHFPPKKYSAYQPNAAHEAISKIATLPRADVTVITQNIDGLHSATRHPWPHASKLIEAHGRLGLYKCIPESDSDTDDDSDEEEHRPVKLGSLRKTRHKAASSSKHACDYEFNASINVTSLLASEKTKRLLNPTTKSPFAPCSSTSLSSPPLCPHCLRPAPPQALLFDEGYHSHSHYQFQKMESWISNADILVFVGTSFAVAITDVALEHARNHQIPVYNFNIDSKVGHTGGSLECNSRLDVENIIGDVSDTLPRLWTVCDDFILKKRY